MGGAAPPEREAAATVRRLPFRRCFYYNGTPHKKQPPARRFDRIETKNGLSPPAAGNHVRRRRRARRFSRGRRRLAARSRGPGAPAPQTGKRVCDTRSFASPTSGRPAGREKGAAVLNTHTSIWQPPRGQKRGIPPAEVKSALWASTPWAGKGTDTGRARRFFGRLGHRPRAYLAFCARRLGLGFRREYTLRRALSRARGGAGIGIATTFQKVRGRAGLGSFSRNT